MAIQRVGIVGAGQMGNGIAHVFALAGYDVLLNDVSADALVAATAVIGRNLDRYERQWMQAHPGESPGPALRRAWDARAWAKGRPDKVIPRSGADLIARWRTELAALGYRDPNSYRRMEKGHRPISPRLAATARALERTGLPRDWAEAARGGTVNPIGVACAALHIERLAREAG